MFIYILIFLASFFLIARSGAILVSSLTYLSRAMGVSEYAIAFTATFIIGAMSVISPIHFMPEPRFTIAVIFLFIGFILFNFFAYSRSVISRREGIVLIFVYAVFLATQYLV